MPITSPRTTRFAPVLSRLRLRDLELVQAVLDLGSVQRAADRLYVSQPAASQMLKNVEAAFGGPLFERSRRGMTANARGVALARRLTALLGDVSVAEAESRSPAPVAILRLGAVFHLALALVPEVLRILAETLPEARVRVREGRIDDLLDDLQHGRLDAVLGRMSATYFGPAVVTDLVPLPLAPDALCVVAGREHPLARRRGPTIAGAARAGWALTPPEDLTRQLFAEAMRRAGHAPPEPRIECSTFAALLEVVERLPLLTVAPLVEARRRQRLRRIAILPIDLRLAPPPVALVLRRAAGADPLQCALEDAARLASARLERGTRPDPAPGRGGSRVG